MTLYYVYSGTRSERVPGNTLERVPNAFWNAFENAFGTRFSLGYFPTVLNSRAVQFTCFVKEQLGAGTPSMDTSNFKTPS